LRNVIERMVIASDDDSLGVDAVPADVVSARALGQRGGGVGYQELKAEAERRIINEALARQDGHVSKTAEALGLADHASLLKIMRRLGIKRG
jgi:DNA-binding NtrC family response regulator